MKCIAFLSASLLAGFLQARPAETGPEKSGVASGRILLLHYHWRHDTLSLVDRKWVPAAVKPKRVRDRVLRQAGGAGSEIPRTPFSYELVSARGDLVSTGYLRDPGLQIVETQEKGEHQIRSIERKVDSADIFLRISEPDARIIRFYRHSRPDPASIGATAAPGGSDAKPGAAKKSAGPEPAPIRTLLAEFPLD